MDIYVFPQGPPSPAGLLSGGVRMLTDIAHIIIKREVLLL
jgi:hypothetical protein